MTCEEWMEIIKNESVDESEIFVSLEMGKILEKIRHCIGLEKYGNDGRLYHRHGKLYYKAYRNHYDPGGDDVPIWEALLKFGYAYKNKMYHVSEEGFEWYRKQSGVIVKRID